MLNVLLPYLRVLTRGSRRLSAVAHLSDDDVERIARLSMLKIDRSSPGFGAVKQDLESVMALLHRVRDDVAGNTSLRGNVLSSLGATPENRIAQLRDDVVLPTSSERVLEHAACQHREGPYFKVSPDS